MEDWLKKTFKITDWISDYESLQFTGDLKAGLTTGMMLIPQGMAYAVIAGMPPIFGLYAGVIPLLMYPLFGTSKQLSVGPVAVDMLIVAAGVSLISNPVNSNYVGLVILLTMMTGVLQLLMGSFRLGALFNFFSRPVIAGFTMAAPIIIAFTQLNNLLGIRLPDTQFVLIIAGEVISKIGQVDIPTFIWGASAIAVLWILNQTLPKLPASVIVLTLGTLIAWLVDLEKQSVEIVGSIPEGLPPISVPQLNFENMRRLLPTALTLALVQFMSVASLGKAFAKRNNYLVDSNHELVAIGASNFMGSLFSSLPVSGSFSRSAAAEQAGAKSPMSNVITSAIVVLTLLFLTPFFYFLPMPILAAIIIVSVFGLIDIKEIKFLYTTKKSEGVIATFTFFCTLLIGIQEGILLGVGASMLTMLFKYSKPAVAELGVIPGTRLFKNLDRNPKAKRIDGVLILRVDASFSFINAEFFRDFILEKSEQQDKNTHFVIIDGSSINMLDTTATDSLKSIIKTLRGWDMELYMSGLKGPVRDVIEKSGLKEFLGPDHYCEDPHEAVERVLEKMDRRDGGNRSRKYYEISN
ncbi:MAG: sulfate permease [Balneolaceae bacterium]|nr:sulfate permease [Balneolaceae bacterium]